MKKMVILVTGILICLAFAPFFASAGDVFTMNIEVPQDYKQISSGEDVVASIKLINMGSKGREDVQLEFSIMNSSLDTIASKRDTVAVETQASFVRSFSLPENVGTGKYSIHARAIYADGKEASAKDSFEIVEISKEWIYWLVGTAILATCIFFSFGWMKRKAGLIALRIKIHNIVKDRRLN